MVHLHRGIAKKIPLLGFLLDDGNLYNHDENTRALMRLEKVSLTTPVGWIRSSMPQSFSQQDSLTITRKTRQQPNAKDPFICVLIGRHPVTWWNMGEQTARVLIQGALVPLVDYTHVHGM